VGYVVAGLEFSVVEPDAEAVGAEAFGEGADDGLVLGAVADENVVVEIVGHVCRIAKPRRGWEEFVGQTKGRESSKDPRPFSVDRAA
jgi:hypothetical protein